MKNKEIMIFDNSAQLVEFAIKLWTQIAEEAVKKRGLFTVSLSGGRTPVQLYKKLSKSGMLWYKTHIFIVDERFVPLDHKDSNYGMINKTLLSNIEIPDKNVHPVTIEKGPGESAALYESRITAFFNLSSSDIPEFDLILLGLGNDGHTASLFPGSAALSVKDHLTTSAAASDEARHDRITITFPVINRARNIIFLVTGSNKAAVVKEVLENESSGLPAASIRPVKGDIYYFLDSGAASLLTNI
jgi:6-phosphogluconolactonase